MSEELLPCPFCGGNAKLVKLTDKNIWRLTHHCKVMPSVVLGWSVDRKSQIARWNTRALP